MDQPKDNPTRPRLDKAPEIESQPFSKTQRMLVVSVMNANNANLDAALTAVAEEMGIDPREGWKPDLQALTFFREKKGA